MTRLCLRVDAAEGRERLMRLPKRMGMRSCLPATVAALGLALQVWSAVILSVSDLTPEHGRISHCAAVGLFAIEVDVTEGEQWRALELTVLGNDLKPGHLRPPSPSVTDKHGRLRDHSGFAIARLTHDDGWLFADNAHPSWNDRAVTLEDAEAIDLSSWPRVRIQLPPGIHELPRPHVFGVAVRLSGEPPPEGMSFRARLDRIELDRNTPWITPFVTRFLAVDTRPPTLTLTVEPPPPLKPGVPSRFVVTASEPLHGPPQLTFRPQGQKLETDGRGRPMRPEGKAWTLGVTPLLRLTPNGQDDPAPVSYSTDPAPITLYPDDGRNLLNGDCRPSWFVGKAVAWRHTPRADIMVDLGTAHDVHAAQLWIPYLQDTPRVEVATGPSVAGPWTAAGSSTPPKLGRGPEFSQPVNQAWLELSPREARFVRFRLTGHTAPQVTEVVAFGDPESVPAGPWKAVVRAWDQALNRTVKTFPLEVAP